ncbi:MAG: hypothetical protein NVS2B12_41250 [Ktedonobacteraceae bacterium]
MLAYVFWHWPAAQVDARSYQEYLINFHRTLVEQRPAGFLSSRVLLAQQAPWVGREAETYEDWYFVENSAALDPLNADAVSGRRQEPHDRAARWAAGGTAGLYRPRFAGVRPLAPRFAYWFAKPAGMSYAQLDAVLQPLAKQGVGTLWQRQMTLGPTAEFCFHTPEEIALPEVLPARVIATNELYMAG